MLYPPIQYELDKAIENYTNRNGYPPKKILMGIILYHIIQGQTDIVPETYRGIPVDVVYDGTMTYELLPGEKEYQ